MPIDVDIVGGDVSTKATVSANTPAGTEPGLYVRVVSQPAAGAGGGPATIVDGGDVAQGAKADAAITDSTTANTLLSFIKGLVKILSDVWDSVNHRLNANITNASIAVTGAFYQTTQPVKLSQAGSDNDVDVLTIPAITGTVTANAGTNLNTSLLALDSTVAKDASLTTLDTDLKAAQPRKIQDTAGGSITVGLKAAAASVPVVIASDQAAVPVSGTFYQTTQPISAASLPLPANAAQETSGNLDILRTTALNLHTALLRQMVTELRVMNAVLAQGLNVQDDLENLRLDAFYNPSDP